MHSSVAARSFEKFLSDTCSTRPPATLDVLFGLLGSDALLSGTGAVSERGLLQKREQIMRAREALLRSIGDGEEYNMPWWRTWEDIELLKESEMRGSDDESERRYK